MELAAALHAAGCDLLVVLAQSARDPALAPFVGPVHLGSVVLIAPAGKKPFLGPFTDMEREEAARTGCAVLTAESLRLPESLRVGLVAGELWAASVGAALESAALATGGRLALAGSPPAGVALAVARELEGRGWEVVDGTELVRRARKRKSAAQRRAVERSAAGVADAFRAIARILAAAAAGAEGRLWIGGERLRAGHLREGVARALVPWGLEQPEGSIVAAGRDAGVPHSQGDSARELAAGEPLVVDLFPKGELFADCTRTFCVGTPPETLREAHELVVATLREAHALARPGVRGRDLQEAACARLHAAGWPTPLHDEGTRRGYVHNLGHGVGYELHELPSFARTAGEEGRLEEGDVLALEPGLYEPDEGWGVRVEDLVAVTGNGVENLTPLPYSMDPTEWADES